MGQLAKRLYKCGARCLDRLWGCCARFVVVDFTYMYAWSNLLTCVSFLMVAVHLMANSIDSVLGIPAVDTCTLSHSYGRCSADGDCDTKLLQIQNGIGSEVLDVKFMVELRTEMLLVVFLFVSLSNSRYVHPCLSCMFVLISLGLIGIYFLFVLYDVNTCGSRDTVVDWGRDYGTTPSSSAMRVAEYCIPWSGGSKRHHPSAALNQEQVNMTRFVKNAWAAWMESASFNVAMVSCEDWGSYCGALGLNQTLDVTLGVAPLCLQWLTEASLGNSVRCSVGVPHVDMDYVKLGYMKLLLLVGSTCKPDIAQASGVLDGAGNPRCVATVSGANFRLYAQPLPDLEPTKQPRVIAHHLQATINAMAGGPAESPMVVHGVPQVPGPENWGLYNNPDFITCATDGVQSCALREAYSWKSRFRSFAGFGLACLLVLAYIWMLVLRCCCCCRMRRPWPCTGVICRSLLASRIVWGLAAALILQLGVSVSIYGLLHRFVRRHEHWGIALTVFILQNVIVVSAVCANFWQYRALRRQLIQLDRDVFFGSRRAPDWYEGPDLEDLKEMGQTTVFYATWFPGLLFWRFSIASWIIALVCGALVWILFGIRDNVRLPFPGLGWDIISPARLWVIVEWIVVSAGVALAHRSTRIYLHTCLLHQHGLGMNVRCICLYSLWDLFACFSGLVLGPLVALADFAKGFVAMVINSLIVSKASFAQLGEFSDYVYCSYCAALYLERVGEDLRTGQENMEVDGEAEYVELDEYYDEGFATTSDGQGVRRLSIDELHFRECCVCKVVCFGLQFCALPLIVGYAMHLLGQCWGVARDNEWSIDARLVRFLNESWGFEDVCSVCTAVGLNSSAVCEKS